MPLNIGEVNKFIVKRETDISYTLSPDDDELTTYVFLHFNQATRKLEPGEKIDAFLYYDQKKRLCATMEMPLITTHKFGLVEVVDIMEKAGVFVNIGIAKDILLSKDYLPNYLSAWPKVGDKVPCILVEKQNQLVARPIIPQDLHFKEPPLTIGQTIAGRVVKINPEGMTICTSEYQFVYLHKSYLRKDYRIGEEVTCKIIHINEAGHYHASTIAQKEYARLSDSDIILNYLKKMGGIVPLGNASTPEEITRYFKMSKSAFKRAVGALYKQRLVTIEDHKITLL
ncbi:MAG: S1-like domain-containing RNA-binding protein [Bacilli bacterium]|nr:S1-like domain-containing RNA-binding protein [Mollicutes bacterium]MDY3899108.1 S1-like domain-containing RNA-binding protein [Bacilli bacterium]